MLCIPRETVRIERQVVGNQITGGEREAPRGRRGGAEFPRTTSDRALQRRCRSRAARAKAEQGESDHEKTKVIALRDGKDPGQNDFEQEGSARDERET